VVSAATDRPTRLATAEQVLAGKPLSDALIEQAAEAAQAVQIDGDLHGSAAYKKHLVGVYLRRAINEARNARH
jgi:carbon-monoxide dehydrogenase medium subunit